MPTSSLPVTGPGSMIDAAPTTDSRTGRLFSTAAASLITAGADSNRSTVGGCGAPAASDSAATIRWIAASTLSRTSGRKLRTLSSSSARSGMMLAFVPALLAPIVSTAISVGATSRDTTVCGPVRNQAVVSRIRGRRSAMRVDDEVRGQLATRFEGLLPHLNERQQRLALGCEARLLGHGGVAAVASAAGVSSTTVRRGVDELDSAGEPLPVGRSRLPGGGRKPLTEHDPELVSALLALVEPDERGDPMSPLRWTTKSLRHLAVMLGERGHPVSAPTVGHLLRANGFSLQGTTKTLEGTQHPDRDAQFRYINEQVKAHQADGEPVVSVDAKKKEQLGQLPAAGREWRPRGEPVPVEDHSFFSMGPEMPLAIPYGVYDLTRDAG